MTQRQLDLLNFHFDVGDLTKSQNQVIYHLNERFSIIVKSHNKSVYILIRSGRKYIKLPVDIFEAICDAKLSINYLRHFLEGITEPGLTG